MQYFQWLVDHKAAILAAIVMIDTLLAEIPSVKASSFFQLISGWARKAKDASDAAAK